MSQEIELTLEQEFSLRKFEELVQEMSREEAQQFLIEHNRLMVTREILYRKLLKHEWQINVDFDSLKGKE